MIRFAEITRLVFINFMENKAKMLLTSLGIIVGSATIVLVIAIGRGSQADVSDQFKNLNAGAIDVSVGSAVDDMAAMMGEMGDMGSFDMESFASGSGGSMPSMSSGGSMPSAPSGGGSFSMDSPGDMGGGGGADPNIATNARGQTIELTLEDVTDIETYITGLSVVTIYESDTTTVYGGDLDEEMSATVVGCYPEYQAVSNLELMYGRFIEDDDDTRSEYVAVIGYGLAEEIFTYPAYAYGEYIEVDGKNYEIVGVLGEMGSVSSGINPDDAVFVPYATAEKNIFGSTGEPMISAVAEDTDDVAGIMTEIDTILSENYPTASFEVSDAGSAMEAATASANTLTAMLLAVASIVFIVGGIGIMNVLFVTVKERTAEIGLLKAIGCSRKAILLEFLLEANMISVFGGVMGVVASIGITYLVEMFGVRMEPSAWGWVLALGFAVVTGTVFGFYPAYRASRLNPIEALTME